jgi:hypothetical protein
MSTPEQQIVDFARRVRQKFPGSYDDVPDGELAQRITEKYPDYAETVPKLKLTRSSGNQDFDSLYEQAGNRYAVNPDLLLEQGRQESINFRPDVVAGRTDSPKKARGIAQFLEGTARQFGLRVDNEVDERKDPAKAIPGQARMMRWLLDRMGGNQEAALAAYNSGHNNPLEIALRNRQRIPETRKYVDTITKALKQARADYAANPTAQNLSEVQNLEAASVDPSIINPTVERVDPTNDPERTALRRNLGLLQPTYQGSVVRPQTAQNAVVRPVQPVSAQTTPTPQISAPADLVRPRLVTRVQANPTGMAESGNIDLYRRPIVKNQDGSVSTVRSMSINVDGKEVLIPTVAEDGSRILSDDEAVEQYKRTGKQLGVFDTPEDANAYAEQLHKQQEQLYKQPTTPQASDALRQSQENQLRARLKQALNNQRTVRRRAEQARRSASLQAIESQGLPQGQITSIGQLRASEDQPVTSIGELQRREGRFGASRNVSLAELKKADEAVIQAQANLDRLIASRKGKPVTSIGEMQELEGRGVLPETAARFSPQTEETARFASVRDAIRQGVEEEQANRRSGSESQVALAAARDVGQPSFVEDETTRRLEKFKEAVKLADELRKNYTPEEKEEIRRQIQALGNEDWFSRAIDVGMARGAASVDPIGAGLLKLIGAKNAGEYVQRRGQAFQDVAEEVVRRNPQGWVESGISKGIELVPEITKAYVATKLGGPVAGFAGLGALESYGRGDSLEKNIGAGLKGAIIGAVFKGTEAEPLIPKIAGVAGTTALTEKLTGASDAEAAQSALANGIFSALGGKNNVIGLTGKLLRLWRNGKPTYATVDVDPQGRLRLAASETAPKEAKSAIDMDLRNGVWTPRETESINRGLRLPPAPEVNRGVEVQPEPPNIPPPIERPPTTPVAPSVPEGVRTPAIEEQPTANIQSAEGATQVAPSQIQQTDLTQPDREITERPSRLLEQTRYLSRVLGQAGASPVRVYDWLSQVSPKRLRAIGTENPEGYSSGTRDGQFAKAIEAAGEKTGPDMESARTLMRLQETLGSWESLYHAVKEYLGVGSAIKKAQDDAAAEFARAFDATNSQEKQSQPVQSPAIERPITTRERPVSLVAEMFTPESAPLQRVEQPVKDGYVRVYRGQGESPSGSGSRRSEESGRWFTTNRNLAEDYAEAARTGEKARPVLYVDLPKDEAGKMIRRAPDMQRWSAPDARTEFILSDEYLKQARPIDEPPHHSNFQPRRIRGKQAGQFKKGKPVRSEDAESTTSASDTRAIRGLSSEGLSGQGLERRGQGDIQPSVEAAPQSLVRPATRVAPRKGRRNLASEYLNENINFGGEIVSRGEAIQRMKAEGADEKLIGSYMLGAKALPTEAPARGIVPVRPTKQEAKQSVKTEKIDKTGLTRTQREYLAGELVKVADKAIEEGGEVTGSDARRFYAERGGLPKEAFAREMVEPITIKVPGDGEFTVKSGQAANRLFQKITGKPIEGFEKASGTSVSVGTPQRARTAPDRTKEMYADWATTAYGDVRTAAKKMRALLEQIKGSETLRKEYEGAEINSLEDAVNELEARSKSDIQAGDIVEFEDATGAKVRRKIKNVERSKYRDNPVIGYIVDGPYVVSKRGRKVERGDFIGRKDEVYRVEEVEPIYRRMRESPTPLTHASEETAIQRGRVIREQPEGLTKGDVRRAARKAVEDRPLSKASEHERARLIEDLSGKDIREIARAALAERKRHRVEVNLEAQELIRRAVEQLYIEDGDPRDIPFFDGMFIPPGRVERLKKVIRRVANAYPETKLRIDKLIRAIDFAAQYDGSVVVYNVPEAIPHEEFHRGSFLGSAGALLESRHSDIQGLINSPQFRKAKPELLKYYDGLTDAQLVEEAAAHISEGNYKAIGLTDVEAARWLRKWFKSYVRKNGLQSLERFEETTDETRQIIEAVRGSLPGIRGKQEQVRRGTGKTDGGASEEEGGESASYAAQAKRQVDSSAILRRSRGEAGFIRIPSVESIKRNAIDILNAPRALMSSFDLSAPLRQGAIFTLTEPRAAMNAARGMLEALVSTKKYNEIGRAIASDPDYALAEDSGLYVSMIAQARATNTGHTRPPSTRLPIRFSPEIYRRSVERAVKNLSASEEAYMSRLAGKLPHVKYSEQAYVAYLDLMRFQLFKKYAAELRRAGKNPTANPKEFKDVAKFINNATGRGDLGETLNSMTPVLNAAFFSPRYIASRFNLLNPGTYARMEPQARKIAVRKMLEFAGLIAGTLFLAQLAGAEVNWDDPESPDWLKVKLGNTRYDTLAGFQQPMRFIYRVTKGLYNNFSGQKNERGQEPARVTGQFLRSKLSPTASFVTDAMVGADFKGQKFNPVSAIGERVFPLFMKDMYDAWQAEGGLGVAKTAPGFFGVGVQTYSPRRGGMIRRTPVSSSGVRRTPVRR